MAEHVTNFVYKLEATDTIRDLITGKLQRQAPPPQQPQSPMPRTPEELQALFESLIAAGQVPQEVLDRMQKGERFQLRVTPQGLALQPAPPDGAAAAPGQGAVEMPKGEAQPEAGNSPTPEASGAAQPAAPASPAQPVPAAAGAKVQSTPARAGRPAGTPKPGRNAPCPCGSGIKYKKCCYPAFD